MTEHTLSPAGRGATLARAARERLEEHPWLGTAALLLLTVVYGLLGGFALAASPFLVAGGLLGMIALAAIVSDPRLGLVGAVLVITLLPFGVVPLPLGGVQFTFLDIALTLTLALWLIRAALMPDERLHVTPVGAFVIVFIALCVIAFVNGMAYGVPAANARLFLKNINSILLFFTVLNCVRTVTDVGRVLAAMIVCGAVAGAIGIALYIVPHDTSIAALSSLGPLGYPTGPGVLRFIAESDRLRAVGTAIDPNVFGALLMIAGALGAAQLPLARPVIPRRWLMVALFPIGVALLLTLSRSSWVGMAVAVGLIATLRYRRLWLILLPLGIVAALGFLPGVDRFVGHLLTGFRAEDRATLMRLGEYKDALELIAAYPWLGVGFGNPPSPMYYIGVSSVYLLLAEHAGLVGLGGYLATMAALYWYVLPTVWRARDERRVGIALSCLAAITAALVAGIFDHHFVNMRFPHVVALFWLCAGLGVAAARRDEESVAASAAGGLR